MRILITGNKGQLGLELTRQLNATGGWRVLGADLPELDITDADLVADWVKTHAPDVVVNCAAYTDVDACEFDEVGAYRVNAAGARNVSVAAFGAGAKIVQISTDYVFDGTARTPLREDHPLNPLNVYGRSKALGERLVRETNPRHFLLRTAWLYGEGRNFVRTVLRLAEERNELNVVADQIGTPTSAVDVARCVIGLIGTERYGTYHATCLGSCSWFEFACAVFAMKGMKVKVNPITAKEAGRPARRPGYSVLDNFMLRVNGLDSFRPWEDALEEYLNKMA